MRDPPITAVGDYDTIEEIVIIGLRLGVMGACVQHSYLKSCGEEPHPLKPCRRPTTGHHPCQPTQLVPRFVSRAFSMAYFRTGDFSFPSRGSRIFWEGCTKWRSSDPMTGADTVFVEHGYNTLYLIGNPGTERPRWCAEECL